jgi:hypothetical protein
MGCSKITNEYFDRDAVYESDVFNRKSESLYFTDWYSWRAKNVTETEITDRNDLSERHLRLKDQIFLNK